MNGEPSLQITDYDRFYEEYINKVKSGQKLYLVETKTPLFRFFVDLDYIGEKKLTRDEITDIVRRIHSVIPGKCVCSVSSPVQKGTQVKSGIHIHWPDLIVTKQKALRLRESIPEDLKEFVDESVYKGSGLRMLWSYKRDGGAPYLPFFDAETNEFMNQQPSVDMLKLFTIKTEYTTCAPEESYEKEFPALQEFIQKYIPGQDKTKVKDRSKNIFRTDSRYCERIRREHKSNHVYFMLDGTCIYQKCYDTECKSFKGRKYRLSPSALKEVQNFQ